MKITFKALYPVHIGGADMLTPMDYVISDKKCHVISEPKLSRLLAEKGLIDDFIANFSQQNRTFSLANYLDKFKLLQQLDDLTLYRVNLAGSPPSKDIRPFIRDAFSRPYIPGSAVKGALRTAILYCILKQLPEKQKEQLLYTPVRNALEEAQEIEKIKADRQFYLKSHSGKFRSKQKIKEDCFSDEKFFQDYLLRGEHKKDPKYDLFRCLIVRDSAPFERDGLAIFPIKVYNYHQQPKPFDIHSECLPSGQSFTIEILFAEKIWREFLAKNPQTHWGQPMKEFEPLLRNPLQCSKRFCADLLEYERQFYQEAFATTEPLPQRADLRIGWGGGLLSTSVALLLPDELRQQLRDTLFVYRPNAPAPKTRKFIERKAQPFFSLGWLAQSAA